MGWRREFTEFVTLLACMSGTVYLVVRLTTLGSGWLLAVSLPFLLIETAAFAQFGVFAFVGWHARIRPRRDRSVSCPPTDVVVDARDADLTALERTLVGANNITAVGSISVVDSTLRADASELVTSLGGHYIVDPRLDGEAATALFEATTSDWYIWLDAGQVAMPDLAIMGSQRLVDGSVAVWQSAVGLLNEDSLAHIQRGRDEEALVREVIAPGLDRLGAAPWFGPGSMIRRDAIEAIGGFVESGESTVVRTHIRLQQRGWASAFTSQPHVRAIAPDDLNTYLATRRQRASAAIGVFATRDNPLICRGLSRNQRLSHILSASMFFTGVRQLLLVLVMIATLVLGRLPLESPFGPVVVCWAASLGTSTIARRALAHGAMRTGDWTRQGWRTLGADIAGITQGLRHRSRGPAAASDDVRGIRTLGKLRTLTAVVIALDLALLLRGATLLDSSLLPNFTVAERVLVITLGLFMLIPMVDVLQLVVTRKQRRRTFRLDTDLEVLVGETTTRTVDLATSGIGVLLPHSPAIGSVLELTLQVPDLAGVSRTVEAQGIVRAAGLDEVTGLVRVGFEFHDLGSAAKRALIEYCMIRATGGSERTHVTEPRTLSIHRTHHHHVHSVRALTAIATAASVAVLVAAPSPASASENSQTYEVQVVDIDGVAIDGAAIRFHDGAWHEVEAVESDGRTAFDTTTDSVTLELTWKGDRMVSPARAGATEIVLARIDSGGDPVDAIDLGAGWTTFEDGMDILPGRVVLRLRDGSIIKTVVASGNVFEVAK